jgi:hypothetical protein
MPSAQVTLTVDRTNIQVGECVMFYWKVEHVREVYFFAEGQRWEDHGVVGEGRRQECPTRPTTYSLRVVKQDGSVETRQIPIQVQHSVPVQPPQIDHFALVPSRQIYAGECVDIQWNVQGAVNLVRILRNGGPIWDGAPLLGQMQDCPPGIGGMTYILEATGPGGTNRMQQDLQVVGQPTRQPPPPPQATGKPVIHSFSLSPGQIKLGDSVTLTWQTGGGTNFVKITSGDDVVMRDAPLSGSTTSKPRLVGTVPYRVIAYNPDDDRVFEVREVIVVQ